MAMSFALGAAIKLVLNEKNPEPNLFQTVRRLALSLPRAWATPVMVRLTLVVYHILFEICPTICGAQP